MDKEKRIALLKRKRKAYLEVFLLILCLSLFITAHLLTSLSDGDDMIWMGIRVDNLITDIVLYSAILLMGILFYLIVKRNFQLRGRKTKRRKK